MVTGVGEGTGGTHALRSLWTRQGDGVQKGAVWTATPLIEPTRYRQGGLQRHRAGVRVREIADCVLAAICKATRNRWVEEETVFAVEAVWKVFTELPRMHHPTLFIGFGAVGKVGAADSLFDWLGLWLLGLLLDGGGWRYTDSSEYWR